MKRLPAYLLVMSTLLLVACGGGVTQENFTELEKGMSPDEVKKILGDPTTEQTGEMLGLSSTTFTYQKGDNAVVVAFVNGRLTHKSGKFQSE